MILAKTIGEVFVQVRPWKIKHFCWISGELIQLEVCSLKESLGLAMQYQLWRQPHSGERSSLRVDEQMIEKIMKRTNGRSQDGGGIGQGDHFLFYKFIERTTERWTKFTKQLLITSSGHQVPRKAAHCLRREVGQKY